MMEQIHLINENSKRWDVKIGSQVNLLLDRKNIEGSERENILNEACEILGNCGNPNSESNDKTGIAIGYVQSGKTLSFTTVSALAVQNGFNLIIVFAGSTKKLVNQTTDRLAEDLNIHERSDVSWKLYKNPSKEKDEEIICDMEEGLFNDKPVLLITVMKNITHLKQLNLLLNSNKFKKISLKTLIIDDEADQASLNTKASKKLENEVSAIYSAITKLRSSIKNHSYIQYTATPQAPLLISILDILSPNFVKILTPGDKYTGGKYFFKRNKESNYPYIIDIPEEEVYSDKNQISKIPPSLVDAMMYFFISVVIGIIKGAHPTSHNRTMMIHPSQLQLVHGVYKRWAEQLKKRWLEELSLDDNDPDKEYLINKFYKKYLLLTESSGNTPDFNEIVLKLDKAIRTTPILLSNSSVKNEFNWKKYYSVILVGGQVLDRGFTVEGLNITYMPRSIGIGNADTIQQRCRFYGYKKSYIDMCRIFIPRESKRAYIDYVLHEEDLRNKLKDFGSKNANLMDYKREFILSNDLNITRKNIISDDINRYRLVGWRQISNLDVNYKQNNIVIEDFITGLKFYDSINSGNTKEQKHQECIIFSEDLIEKLLIRLSYKSAKNSLLVNHILSLISILNNYEEKKVTIVNMSNGNLRKRSLNDKESVPQLLQGKNIKTNYNGDREVSSENNITIQLHNIQIKNSNITFRTLAFHIPKNQGQSLISLSI